MYSTLNLLDSSLDRKKSVENAINRYYERQQALGTTREPTRKNKTPERDVQKECLAWGRSNGFSLHVVEASRYNASLGQKGDAKVEAGFSDLVGNTQQGLACYIELKAKGRRSTLSYSQREFLVKKIEQSCFAVVVDSVQKLQQYWKSFCSLKTPEERKNHLLSSLPQKVPQRGKKKDQDAFEKRYGF